MINLDCHKTTSESLLITFSHFFCKLILTILPSNKHSFK